MKILFISHNPHEVHLEFAKTIGAKIKITPMDGLVKLSKKWFTVNCLYPLICFIYGLFLNAFEKIILVDGGSSIWIAVALKIKNPDLKMVYLDGDLFITHLKNNFLKKIIFKRINAIISVSEKNKKIAEANFNGPIEVVNPYLKKIVCQNLEKKNYGLYVGRLDPDKKIKRTIDFALQCPYFEKFIIAGDGILKNYVKNISKINKKIIYLGKIKNIGELYGKCKFLIHIPDSDPYPCTTMEAALCGCFPIISNGVGTKYLFDKIFIIDDPNNFDEINQKIDWILKNELAAKELLKDSVKMIPSKEKSLAKFKKVFEEIIK